MMITGVLNKLLCDHDYEIKNQFKMESEFDIVISRNRNPNTHHSLTRKVVTDYKCDKCKKWKRLVEKTETGL